MGLLSTQLQTCPYQTRTFNTCFTRSRFKVKSAALLIAIDLFLIFLVVEFSGNQCQMCANKEEANLGSATVSCGNHACWQQAGPLASVAKLGYF
jgi:hypothetical protein